MRARHFLWASVVACLGAVGGVSADPREPLLAALSKQAAEAEAAKRVTVVGKSGWLFPRYELRAISVGPFWGEDATKVSRASRNPDPLPALVDLSEQCKKVGAKLVVVPVPPKVSVYPEALLENVPKDLPRLDRHHQAFYALLREKGVEVVDLQPLFYAKRNDEGGLMYCRQDAHWSSYGSKLAAEAVAATVAGEEWVKTAGGKSYTQDKKPLEITGDLFPEAKATGGATKKESLPIYYSGLKNGEWIEPVPVDRESPVLVLGDSHAKVFHDGGKYHSRAAGFPDHLAQAMGMPVDMLASDGSASYTVRLDLYRRKDQLKGKKLVIYCFTFREFTETLSGWRPLPIVK